MMRDDTFGYYDVIHRISVTVFAIKLEQSKNAMFYGFIIKE